MYNYTDHLGNVRLSYAKNGVGTEIIEESNYYPFGLKHEGYNILAGNLAYKYKYNGKELQETGMYDYGARFYMPDIARFGTIDPRSAYTHEAYSYVWNNPIFFADPTGMEGEGFATCPTCPNTKEFQPYINDPHNEFVYDPKTKKVEIVTPIEEVTIPAYRPIENKSADVQVNTGAILSGIAIGGRSTPNPYAWLAAGGATLLMMLTNQSDIHFPIGYTTQIPIWPSRSNPSEEADDTDVNGVPVPVDDSGYKKPVDQTIEKGENKFDFAKKRKGSQK